MPAGVVRLGVSLEPELLSALDRWVRQRNSPSRSEALRALIRQELSGKTLEDPDAEAVATLTLLYRHRSPRLLERLAAAEHRWGEHIRSSLHVHLQGEACMEVLVLMGRGREIQAAVQDLRGVKGVALGEFVVGAPQVAGGRTGHLHPH
ncbi:MAG: nickel-responsive transcriptional regulator NikR [Euryarchaeota archaeon]|nr:nickel-responsive transcriptional regulator NikR [Euryarchaeota archaeon]MDE1835838.1 nickel-responsive transcriptional regulator NikR [Euryarchaeota archaeon]MDE1880511.1 nickel-responsive transcriptional regulator NikR [Euryarchaeota archaeon]MDE2045812.1 nickel-responsive transcriptional regulator NikR [Thermoplasmata archaeon]